MSACACFQKKTYEFCNKTGHAINTRTFTIYSICLWTCYEGNSKFMVFQDVNYDPDFYIFMSTDSYNDRLLVILHALRITFCVCSPVDSFFCGVAFGKCSIKIYRKQNAISCFNSKYKDLHKINFILFKLDIWCCFYYDYTLIL